MQLPSSKMDPCLCGAVTNTAASAWGPLPKLPDLLDAGL